MGIYAETPARDFQVVEPGTYVARCIGMIEIGTIMVNFGDGDKRVHKAAITWELPTEKAVFDPEKGEQPFIITKEYNLSMHSKSALRAMLESWRSKPFTEDEAKRFDITQVLTKECMLTVVHEASKTDTTVFYAKVASVSKLMKGVICPPQINPTKLLCYENFDWGMFATLSDKMKSKLEQSVEFQKLQKPSDFQSGSGPANALIDDVPF